MLNSDYCLLTASFRIHSVKNFVYSLTDITLGLRYLAAGNTIDKIVEEFPNLTKDIAACLDYARDLSEFEVAAT